MLSQRKKRLSLRRTRLRFGRRAPIAATPPLQPFGWQTLATMDLSEYDDDMIELKRRFEALGMNIQIPKRGAVWKEPTPLRPNGVSLSDVVIQPRHGYV